MNDVGQVAPVALGMFSSAGSRPFGGLVLDGRDVIATSALHALCDRLGHPLPEACTTLELFDAWNLALPALRAAAEALRSPNAGAEVEQLRARCVPVSELTVHAPVAARQIFMSGANYFTHVVDMIVDMGPGKTPETKGMNTVQLREYAENLMRRRQVEGSPYVFSKPVSALSGPFDPVRVPSFAKEADWEAELAVVIGTPARCVSREDALRHVAGYTIANDISNRDWLFPRGEARVLGSDWLTAKSCPTYLPLGPVIVPAELVSDPHDLRIQLRLNGELKQDGHTSDMIFGVARLIEHISHVVRLLPGDIICTGSPAGNGTHYHRYLHAGDTMEAAISGLGRQRTPVLDEVLPSRGGQPFMPG